MCTADKSAGGAFHDVFPDGTGGDAETNSSGNRRGMNPESAATRFQPGNPGGAMKRTKGKSLAVRMRDRARGLSDEALDVLAEIMRDTEVSPTARADAAAKILDRAFGRPVQSHKMDDEQVDELSELLDRINGHTRTVNGRVIEHEADEGGNGNGGG